MKIETTLDKAQLSVNDLQTILKRYIKDTTGRDVNGYIKFQHVNSSNNLTTAWCELEPIPQPEPKLSDYMVDAKTVLKGN